jgi:hypothetical protein
MKTIFFSLLVTSITLMSCKKESQNTATNSDSITTPDTVSKIPVSAPIDTLVAAPKSDTASLKKDSAK